MWLGGNIRNFLLNPLQHGRKDLFSHLQLQLLLIIPKYIHNSAALTWDSKERHVSSDSLHDRVIYPTIFGKGHKTLSSLRMHGDNLFQSPETREQLSPRTVPKNHRTDPFYSPGGHNDSAETSPYTSALFSPDDMMPSNNRDIQFESVDWATKPVARTDSKPRNITPTKELPGAETINLTPPMIQHQRPKPTHYSPPRILTRQQSPIDKSGLGIHMYDNEKSIVRHPMRCFIPILTKCLAT